VAAQALTFDVLRLRCSLTHVNIRVRAGYWRFIEAPGGADKAQH
jgi:hypothetical protein